jgi:recombination protein RecR
MKKGLEKFYDLVEAFENLPSIGKKSAQRLAYHIIMNDNFGGMKLAHCIENAINHIQHCSLCGSISEHEICDICLDETREKQRLCIVQSAKDIFIIEESKQYDGYYFVLSEIEEFALKKLTEFIESYCTKEVLFAITPSLSNDAFILFIEDQLKEYDLQFSKIAQGVPTGVSLENVDILSLAKAIQSKVGV